MLKVGGENVSALEVEGYLVTHPAVSIAQVVAAPDERYGEVPAAFIQLAGQDATEAELIDFCLGQIATFKVPRYVRFVDEWPMSGTKIQKFVLREQIASELREPGVTARRSSPREADECLIEESDGLRAERRSAAVSQAGPQVGRQGGPEGLRPRARAPGARVSVRALGQVHQGRLTTASASPRSTAARAAT